MYKINDMSDFVTTLSPNLFWYELNNFNFSIYNQKLNLILNTEKKWIGIKELSEDGRIKFNIKIKFIRIDEDQLHVNITKKDGQLCEWYPVFT